MRDTHRWWRTLVGGLAVLALFALGCGGDDDDGDTQEDPDADLDTTAVLKVGYDYGPFPLYLDPATAGSVPIAEYYAAVYGSLLRRESPDGETTAGLAEEAEVVDPKTLRITLREDLTFTDGTPLDSEALKFSIERNTASKNQAGLRANILAALDRVEIEDDLTVVVHLKEAIAGQWYDMLPDGELMVYSPAAARAADAVDPKVGMGKAPVGAGPFRLKSWEPQRVVLEKNPDYYAAEDVKIAGIDIVNVTPQARVNALLSGAIDYTPIGAGDEAAFASGTYEVEQQLLNSWYSVLLNRTAPPLSVAKVRQALNFAIDREAINDAVFGGNGDPEAKIIAEGFPHEDLLEPAYEHDPERAEDLLAEAGYPNGFEITFAAAPGEPTRILEIMQPQLAEVGIRMSISSTTTGQNDFFAARRVPGYVVPQTRPMLSRLATCCTQGGFANIGNIPMPEVEAIYKELSALAPADPAAGELYVDLQEALMVDEAWALFFGFVVESRAWNADRIADLPYTSVALTRPTPDWARVSIKK